MNFHADTLEKSHRTHYKDRKPRRYVDNKLIRQARISYKKYRYEMNEISVDFAV
jgi:hypothetical protein